MYLANFQLSNMSKILVTFNSAVNFIIYFVCSRDFRSAFRQVLCAACCFWRSCMGCCCLSPAAEPPPQVLRRHSPPQGLKHLPEKAGLNLAGIEYPAAHFNQPNRVVIRPAMDDPGGIRGTGIRPNVVSSPVGKR